MPWLLESPGHQHPRYWLCRICKFFSYTRKDFNYACRVNVEEWFSLDMYFYISCEEFSTLRVDISRHIVKHFERHHLGKNIESKYSKAIQNVHKSVISLQLPLFLLPTLHRELIVQPQIQRWPTFEDLSRNIVLGRCWKRNPISTKYSFGVARGKMRSKACVGDLHG